MAKVISLLHIHFRGYPNEANKYKLWIAPYGVQDIAMNEVYNTSGVIDANRNLTAGELGAGGVDDGSVKTFFNDCQAYIESEESISGNLELSNFTCIIHIDYLTATKKLVALHYTIKNTVTDGERSQVGLTGAMLPPRNLTGTELGSSTGSLQDFIDLRKTDAEGFEGI